MTPQEIFDTVARALLAQDRMSMIYGSCAYRGTSGRKCAVGLLLPDEMYSPDMEGYSVAQMATRFPSQVPGYFRANVWLLDDLQTVHDCGLNWSEGDIGRSRMRDKLAQLAQRHGLDPKEAKTAPAYHERKAA